VNPTETVAQLNAALARRYEIDREIGRGGMATVYLARDVRHDRKVAVKVLNPELGAVLGVERFLAEIKVTANLQHPNLLPLFDSGEVGGLLFYVMPYVDGESLRAKLDREKELPIDDAVRIAVAVASALEYAHARGVIHRDLKPENILLHAGQPVVADFGIALAVSNAGGARVTQTGISLGTPQYMSPEQATGDRAIDGRTDIYSLGAVLYEMLTGEPPHSGTTAQAIIARVLTEQPRSVRATRANVPAHIDAAIEHALEKLPADRFSSAHDFLDALQGSVISGPRPMRARTPDGAARWTRYARRNALLVWVLGPVAIVALGTVAGLWGRLGTESRAPLFKFSVTPAVELEIHGLQGIALSPDGTHLVFPGRKAGVIQLYDQPIGQHGARPIGGTEDASQPFFSPDGRWVGFLAGGKLKKVELAGGTSVPICDVPDIHGAAWGPGDTIVFGSGGLFRVAALGGIPKRITSPDSKQDEADHQYPDILPDGKAILFTVWTGGFSHPQIFVRSLKTGKHWPLLEGTNARFVPTGHIVFYRGGSIWAVRFDPDRLQLIGSPAPIVEGIHVEWGVLPYFSLARNGTLAYVPGPAGNAKQLVWVDRKGVAEPLGAPPRPYDNPVLSPDGHRIAVVVRDDNPDVWMYELTRGTSSRQTLDPGEDETPVWMPDSKRLIFAGTRHGTSTLFMKTVDENAEHILLSVPGGHRHAFAISPKGDVLAFQEYNQATTGADIWMLPLEGDRKPSAFQNTAANEDAARFSPDGHWIAYVSNEGLGRTEVYVRPYPRGDKQQVSREGGTEPVWARNGREMFYRSGDKMMVVDVTTEPTLKFSLPRELFTGCYDPLPWAANYDVTLDGRFLMIRSVGAERCQSQINVELNWLQELRRRLPK